MNSEDQQETENKKPLLNQWQLGVLIDMLMSNNKFVNAIITRVMNSGLVGNAILKSPDAAQALTRNTNSVSAVGTAADVYIQLNGAKLLMDAYENALPTPAETEYNPFAQEEPASILKQSRGQTATPVKNKAKVSVPAVPVETVNLEAKNHNGDEELNEGTKYSEGEEQNKTMTRSSAKGKTRAAREKRAIDEYVSNFKGRIAKDETDLAHQLNAATQLEGDEKAHFLGQVHAYIRKHCRLQGATSAKRARELLVRSWKMKYPQISEAEWVYIQHLKYDPDSEMKLKHIQADK
jgi:hypothetical protein